MRAFVLSMPKALDRRALVTRPDICEIGRGAREVDASIKKPCALEHACADSRDSSAALIGLTYRDEIKRWRAL